MVKKKISGQTIAIIVLVVLLICTITFGGVYAFYSSSTNKVSGTILMATLDIEYKKSDLGVGESGESEILITNSRNVVPNELLGNSPLTIINDSATSIYLAVLYKVQKATTDEDKHLDDIYKKNADGSIQTDADGNKVSFGVIDIGTDDPTSIWTDFVFDTTDYEEYANDEVVENDNYVVRCFVTTLPVDENQSEIIVIEKNNLKLHKEVGNEFQQQAISFTFQAHAIASNGLAEEMANATTDKEKCAVIVKAIYFANGYKFSI